MKDTKDQKEDAFYGEAGILGRNGDCRKMKPEASPQ